MTHILDENSPTWEQDCGFECANILDYEQCETGTKFRVQQLRMHSGIGTHMDAPAHCKPGGYYIDDILLEKLIVPCIVIDVSQRANDSYLIAPSDIELHENKFGKIAKGSLVIFYTGWDKYWKLPIKYHNNYKFPSISADSAQLLCERAVVGVGIDTLSPDVPESGYPVHNLLLNNNIYIVENVANAQLLPPAGSYCIALPIKIRGGTEAPIRMVGIILKD